jgi:hypothetical protein
MVVRWPQVVAERAGIVGGFGMSKFMTWGELKAAIESAGVLPETRIDAIDLYSPLAGENLVISFSGGEVAIETRDVAEYAKNRWYDPRHLYCQNCRAEFLDPRPALVVRYRAAKSSVLGVIKRKLGLHVV